MSIVKPFAAIRPAPEKASRIAALPYDVYNSEEAREEVERNPLSFLKIDRAETLLEPNISLYNPRVYEKAKEILWDMVSKGDFVKDSQKCYYIYELTMAGRVQTGLVACASIDDYANGVIKRHETTRPVKEEDRIRHISVCHAQTGPIYLSYRFKKTIHDMLESEKASPALFDFVSSDDQVRHRGFRIDDPSIIRKIEEEFSLVESLYIADGHHRAASAVKVGLGRRECHPGYTGEEEFNFFLSVLFPDDHLLIMDYNRVVKSLNGFSDEEFLEEVKLVFPDTTINERKDKHPQEEGEFSMYLAGQWYTCKIPKEYLSHHDPVADMDVSVLQDRLLEPVLGIKVAERDKRIDFVGGIRGLEELEQRVNEDCRAAFAMYPTSIREMFAVADAGELMPAKSTWFEPKLRSGLFIHEIEEDC